MRSRSQRSLLFSLISLSVLALAFQNCSQPGKIDLSPIEETLASMSAEDSAAIEAGAEEALPPLPGQDMTQEAALPPPPGQDMIQEEATVTGSGIPKNPTELSQQCSEAASKGKITRLSRNLEFPNPGKACRWGADGNLSVQDKYVQARTEQSLKFELPPGSIICDVKLSNLEEQSFKYDDNIIITMNGLVLASTTNFSRHFESIAGLSRYSWDNLVHQPAQNSATDTVLSKQYCAGTASGLSSCSFPETQKIGRVNLNFSSEIIQTILGVTSPDTLQLSMITTGDNDSTDCQHVPLTFAVEVDYY
jgi:hypothetical protein